MSQLSFLMHHICFQSFTHNLIVNQSLLFILYSSPLYISVDYLMLKEGDWLKQLTASIDIHQPLFIVISFMYSYLPTTSSTLSSHIFAFMSPNTITFLSSSNLFSHSIMPSKKSEFLLFYCFHLSLSLSLSLA